MTPVRLPPHNGVPASRLQLPPGDFKRVIDCLCTHFSAVPRGEWEERFTRGRVFDEHANVIDADTPYRVGMQVQYYREVAQESRLPFEEQLVHVDEHLIVADKPHFLPVTPAGSHVEETLLARLVRRLGNPHIVPLHRIDSATAGLVLFSANPATRSRYQALFRLQVIHKAYEALAGALPEHEFPMQRRTCIVRGEPFYRMREIDAAANAETRIDVLDRSGPVWLYSLSPRGGRKHQLRVQMAGLGAAVLNDDLYPELRRHSQGDFSRPLQLLARSLQFTDPLDGCVRRFESGMRLALG